MNARHRFSPWLGVCLLWVAGLTAARAEHSDAYQTLDLTPCYNKLPVSFEAGKSWAAVPWGRQVFAGVPFELGGVMELVGLDAARVGQVFPGRHLGLIVGRKAGWIHAVHGAGYREEDGVPMLQLRVRYADGSSRDLSLCYGVHSRNWWKERNETQSALGDPRSSVVWTGSSPETDNRGIQLRLFLTSLPNPRPESAIQSLDVLSTFSRATPFLLALTVGDAGTSAAAAVATTPPAVSSAVSRPGALPTVSPAIVAPGPIEVIVRRQTNDSPVAGATVRFTLLDEEGEYPYGEQVTDAAGQTRVDFPTLRAPMVRLAMAAVAPGLAVQRRAIELSPTAQRTVIPLEAGRKIGGVVRDPADRPVAGARILVSQSVKDEAGQSVFGEVATVVSDAEGRWECSSIAPGASHLTFALAHPRFMPAEYEENAAGGTGEFLVAHDDLYAAKAVLKAIPAPIVAGTVVDERGQFLGGATVRFQADGPGANRSGAGSSLATDVRGAFEIVRSKPGPGRLFVWANGYAPQQLAVEATAGAANPLRVALQPGEPLAAEVSDSGGLPIAGARGAVIWNGVELPFSLQSDAKGLLRSDRCLPAEPVQLRVTREGYRAALTLCPPRPRDRGPLPVQLARAFLLVGRVLDADTGAPIPAFTVIRGTSPGLIFRSGQDLTNWEHDTPHQGRDGALRWSEGDRTWMGNAASRARIPTPCKFLVRAPGYLPIVSPEFSDSGWHTNEFRLHRGASPAGVVLGPNGQPVEGADVAVLGYGYVSLGPDGLRAREQAEGATKTDADGRFALPALLPSPRLIAVHESGVALFTAEQLASNATVHLGAWGSLEGVAKTGTRPWSNQDLCVIAGDLLPRFSLDADTYQTTTDETGRFRFERVPPGAWRLARRVQQGARSWQHDNLTPIAIPPGENARVVFGGVGRPVVGKLALSDPQREVDLASSFRSLNRRLPMPSAKFLAEQRTRRAASQTRVTGFKSLERLVNGVASAFQPNEAAQAWTQSAEFQEALRNQRTYSWLFGENGEFRVDNVVPGTYDMNIILNEPDPAQPMSSRSIGSLHREVVVPEVSGAVSDEPFDLGTLTLKVSPQPPGKPDADGGQ